MGVGVPISSTRIIIVFFLHSIEYAVVPLNALGNERYTAPGRVEW